MKETCIETKKLSLSLFLFPPHEVANKDYIHGMVAIARHETAIARDLGKIAIAQKIARSRAIARSLDGEPTCLRWLLPHREKDSQFLFFCPM